MLSLKFSINCSSKAVALVPVIEHQALIYYHVLSYETIIDEKQIPEMTLSMKNNISVLDLQLCGNIIITKKGLKTEFIIPVDKEFKSNAYYKYKPVFKLVNAVRIRHYGDFFAIDKSLKELKEYVYLNNLTAVTNPYYVDKDIENDIIDVYVGISENIL